MIVQVVLTLAGLWLMAAPAVLGYGEPASTSDRIAGPVMAAVAFISIATITRGLRWANLPVGLWLLGAPWLLDLPVDATVSSTAVGLLAVAMAGTGAPDQERYAGGWRSLWEDSASPPH